MAADIGDKLIASAELTRAQDVARACAKNESRTELGWADVNYSGVSFLVVSYRARGGDGSCETVARATSVRKQ